MAPSIEFTSFDASYTSSKIFEVYLRCFSRKIMNTLGVTG